jgi:hypothetical protein
MLFAELRTCHAFFVLGDCSSTVMIVGFWILTINPTFVNCYDPRDMSKSWVLISIFL